MAVKEQLVTDDYALYMGDCIDVMAEMPDESVHLSLYSPPFGGLYSYSSSDRDLSNAYDLDEFMEHYAYVVREKFRVTMPGRISCVHCTDIALSNTGIDHMLDLSGEIIRLHEKEGFRFIGRYCVWKEPLAVRNRTMAKKLFHRAVVEDASRCSNAAADYVVVFRRTGTNTVPIEHPTGFLNYAGSRTIPGDVLPYRDWGGSQLENRYSHWIWRQYASAFWDDIRVERVLPYKESRDDEDEQHVHPLQLDVIDRCVVLWSNPGEIVFTPFMGIGSEVYGAVVNGRKGVGVELKDSYYRQACLNVVAALEEKRVEQEELFV